MSSTPKYTASRSRLRAALVIAGSILLAGLTVLVLAEVGLRVTEWALLSGRDNGPAAGSESILCAGDSWTYGVESEDPARFSYPAQLQNLVDARAGKFSYRVINRGRPGLNSRLLRMGLEAQLERYKPSVVVMLVGGTNFFDRGQELSGGREAPRSFWRQLKVVRIWGVLISSRQGPRQPRAQILKVGHVRTDLVTAVSLPQVKDGFRDDAQGLPLARATGCAANMDKLMAAAQQAASSGAAAVARVVQQAPRCTMLMVHAADLCFARRKFDCARRFASEALKQDPRDPRAVVVLAAVQHHLRKPLARATLARLEQITSRHPKFMRARRLRALTLLLGQVTLCELRRELTAASRACPRCGWVKAAMAVFRREVQTPGTRILREDLAAIHDLCRKHRSRLLMLNYPESDRDVCGHLAHEVIAAFARQRKVPIIEIGKVLGGTGKSAYYADQDHPNTRGYARLARKVLDQLWSLGWVKKGKKGQVGK